MDLVCDRHDCDDPAVPHSDERIRTRIAHKSAERQHDADAYRHDKVQRHIPELTHKAQERRGIGTARIDKSV